MTAEPRPAKADPRVGMVLQDRYRIVRKIGDGGMGAVYEGEHLTIKRRVAIKVLHAQFATNPEIVARFHREAQAATAIGHPNIVEVTDMGRFEDGTSYMVLEYLEGRDWAHDIKQQGPQALGKCVHIISQVCDALEAAHQKGIVHRDLKPENVFLVPFRDDPNFAKVLDFGISKVMDDAVADRSLTQTGTALGTPYYMAPEQCQGKKDVDPRADIYSLGVMLFQALTAQYPFDDESYPMLVLKICTEAPPSLTRYRPDVPVEVEHIVNRMLAKHRDHRFARCAEVKAALAPFAAHHAAPVLAADAPRTSAHGPSVLAGVSGGGQVTPTGTAVLESGIRPPSGTPYPASPTPAPGSNAALIGGVIGGLALLLVAGVAAGAWVAFNRGGEAQTPVAGSGPTEPGEDPATDPVAEPPAEPLAEPPAVAEPAVDPAPSAEVAPSAPTDVQPALVEVRVNVQPPNARVRSMTIDGEDVSHATSYRGDLAPGEHQLVVEAEGFQRRELTFTVEAEGAPVVNVVLDRERTRPGHGGGGGQVAATPPVTSQPPTSQPPASRPPASQPQHDVWQPPPPSNPTPGPGTLTGETVFGRH